MRLNEFDPILTESLAVGDPVIITGNVEFQGKTGDVREIGRDGSFVVVNLYNYGPQSFQASDVSRNDYADLEDDEEVAEGSQPNDIAVYHHTGPNADKKAQAHAMKLGSEYGHFRHDRADKNNNLHIVTQKRYFPDYAKQQGVAEGEGGFDIEDMVMDQYRNGNDVWEIAQYLGIGEDEVQDIIDSNEKGVTEVSKATIDRYVSKASDAHGDADFKARMSKHDPDKRSYHVDQKKTAEKRRQGISRALDRMSRPNDVAEQERVGNMDADRFDAAMARLKQLAGAGPLKTVYDPAKRVYRNVPTAVQPTTQPKK
jgi:hypothetical protein